MNKKIKLLLLTVIIFIVAISTKTVYATDTTASLETSNTEIKSGDTFTVTFKASCDEGINGISAEIEYDTDKLELIELKSADTNKWTNLGTGLNVEIIHANSSTETDANIFTVSFKVKEGIEDEDLTIFAKNIEIDSDTSVTPINLGTKQTSVTVTKEEKQENNITEGNKEENKEETVQTITAGTKSTDSSTSKTLPKTGIKTISFVAVGMIIVLAIVFYLGYKRYMGI